MRPSPHPTSDGSSDSDTLSVSKTVEKKVSCQPCREAKVKCVPSSSSACSRCTKLDRECFYRSHKRGRKPGKIKLQQILRRLDLLDKTLREIEELNREVGDKDADALVGVLRWQLERSKFFSKNPTQASSASAALYAQQGKAKDDLRLGQEQGERSQDVATMRRDASRERRERRTAERGAGTRGDYNMLVDIEDHASVARVTDEFPTLSNPLKLLAQASSVRETMERKRKRDSPLPPHSIPGSSTQLLPSAPTSTAGASTWASTYFSRGAFHPVYDNTSEFDPIDQALLNPTLAEELLKQFYAKFGVFMHIFDPTLSTLPYIRKHSSFLLTVICALSAEYHPPADHPGLAAKLREHYLAMIPYITSGEGKNVEMAQAFFLLASYGTMSSSAMSDSTWMYLGTAIRIATELGCNLVCYSYSTPLVHKNEHYQRQLRNTERLWINLWNLEKTVASQTGQRMHLADEGVIAQCAGWESREWAVTRQDEVLVAQIELRRIVISKGDFFNTHLGKGSRMMGEEQLKIQLEFFRKEVQGELKRWEERWLSQSRGERKSESTPLEITGPLSLDYAALVTYALPLPIKYSADVRQELGLLYRQCYLSATNYMSTFIDRARRGEMGKVTNGFVVSTVYAVVFALDLARKSGREEFSFVSRKRVLNLANGTVEELRKVGEGRNGCVAGRYAAFLKGVLERFDGNTTSSSASEGEDEDGFTNQYQQQQRHEQKHARGVGGTRASQNFSNNTHFSPLPQYPSPVNGVGWVPPRHHTHTPHRTQQEQGQGQTHAQPPANVGVGGSMGAAAMSPASWFGTTTGGAVNDPQWEWMMKDLDFFNVDGGGGGGGEPILDQMGRLFG